MPSPAPNLDDRHFADLVEEALIRARERCPEWTTTNPSDPGVTLIETVAAMVEQMIYRLNRVPELHERRILDLIGVRQWPARAAYAALTFWLAAPQEGPIVVPARTQVANVLAEGDSSVVFGTTEEARIPPVSWTGFAVAAAHGEPADLTRELASGRAVRCFSDLPTPGDAFHLGLSDAVPGCALLLRVDCRVAGIGIDPRTPPWRWEAWDGRGWAECEIETDTTGGFSTPGDLVLHVPATHVASVLADRPAGWLRCRLTDAEGFQPSYVVPPLLTSVTAAAVGVTVPAVHADVVTDVPLGVSAGTPGQRFRLTRGPLAQAGAPVVLVVGEGPDAVEWHEVGSFADSAPEDPHVTIDHAAGEVVFGPALRQDDGLVTQHGAVPPKGAPIRVARYPVGGGRRGNVGGGTLVVLRTAVPFVSRVENRRAATGGVDAETLANAVARAPLQLSTRDRAVTAEDYEYLARTAAPEVARVRCVPIGDGDGVRVLVVPEVPDPHRLVLDDLRPPAETLERIARFLDDRRCVGARVHVEPPRYRGISVSVSGVAARHTDPVALRDRMISALYDFLNPLRGGRHGTGWPFGRTVGQGDIFALLHTVPGVDSLDRVDLVPVEPVTGRHGDVLPRIELDADVLPLSFDHEVRMTEGGG